MGEPLLNVANVATRDGIMLDDFAYGLSKRRATLSTSGVVPALDMLRDKIDVALAISLHAPNDELCVMKLCRSIKNITSNVDGFGAQILRSIECQPW